ncbi:MAG TPA: YegS/Rv2252/BmrU family lipid kinase, partial [Armatimonadota bacterium]|nr:YegS/Rv2252/BmrU family lipid kinase [Armatimonadota bacterium]
MTALLTESREQAPAAPPRVAVIFNPVSGTADPEVRRAQLQAQLRAAGLELELTETQRGRGAAPLAREALADGVERVIVSGGDGSVAEAAGALAGTDAVLGVVPGGTGNLLAVNLGLPPDCPRAMELALHGEPRRIDVGVANGRPFLILAGIGADARMVKDADREAKRRFGALAYFLAAWKNIGRPLAPYRVTIDGRRIRCRAQAVLVANLGRITGGVELIPGSHPDDGLLEIAVLRARNVRELAAVAWSALRGERRRDRLFQTFSGRHVLVETRRPEPFEVDGNDLGVTTRLEVTVRPGALKIVAPPPGEAVAPALLPSL